MIKLLKAYKKLIMILFLPYLAVLFVLVYPTHLSVTAPGGLTPVKEFIEIEGYDLVDNFNTVYVYSYYPITIFQSIILKDNETMDIEPISDYEKDISLRDSYLQGQLSKHVSLVASVISAYELASEVNDDISIAYHFDGLYIYSKPSRIDEIEIGDHVVKINQQTYENLTLNEFALLIGDGSDLVLTIRRTIAEVEFEFDYHYMKQPNDIILSYYPKYVIDESTPTYDLPGLNSIVGGPSGGLLQALSIYASLVNINLQNVKIAGTGTISVAGNVGKIGGIVQKIYTAKYHHVDIFFAPNSQISEIENINVNFEIVPVNTFREAVEWLNGRFN